MQLFRRAAGKKPPRFGPRLPCLGGQSCIGAVPQHAGRLPALHPQRPQDHPLQPGHRRGPGGSGSWGWRARPLAETAKDTVAWFRAQGKL
jgi:hypothetical protein